MHPLFRKKSRVLALFSLVFLAQCCCCFLPLSWQTYRPPAEIQALIQKVETRLQIDFPVVSQLKLP